MKKIWSIFLVSFPFILASCNSVIVPSGNDSSSINVDSSDNSSESVSSENAESSSNDTSSSEESTPTIEPINISNKAFYTAKYLGDSVQIDVESNQSEGTHNVFFTYDKDLGLNEYNSYFYQISASDHTGHLIAWNGSSFEDMPTTKVKASFDGTNFSLIIKNDGFTSQSGNPVGKFAFFPEYYDKNNVLYNMTSGNKYILYNYPQTWVMIKEDGELYRDLSFENNGIDNWEMPVFTDCAGSRLAFSCSEKTIEGCIVSAMCAERLGATAFDLRLEGLNAAGLLTENNIKRITHSIHIPVLGIFYDGKLSQQARLDGLKVGVRGGCSAIDLQGFMYWEGSTNNTQTEDNINYWENLGFDMSFVDSSPIETTIDPTSISQQKAYIQEIHEMGAEVLLSAHNEAIFTKDQAIAYAKFIEDRGVDVIKLVAQGENVTDIEECIEANKVMNNYVGCKFSMHLNATGNMRITRLVCPLFYGAFMAFCYETQTHLAMMAEIKNSPNFPDKNVSIDDAITYMKNHTDFNEVNTVEMTYRNCPTGARIVKKAFGAASRLDNRWACNDDSSVLTLREPGTNSFNIRGFSYNLSHRGDSFSYSCSISGTVYPYYKGTGSPIRVPKVGIMIGDYRHMVAFAYNTHNKTVDLYSNVLDDLDNARPFSYDSSPAGDRIEALNIISSSSYSVDFTDENENINMGVYYDNTNLKLYFSEGSDDLSLVATVPLATISQYLGSNIYVGNLVEMYMGSASKDYTNRVSFTDISFTSNNNIFE